MPARSGSNGMARRFEERRVLRVVAPARVVPAEAEGSEVVTIEGVGSCRNQFYAEAPVPGRY